jgi:surface antigen
MLAFQSHRHRVTTVLSDRRLRMPVFPRDLRRGGFGGALLLAAMLCAGEPALAQSFGTDQNYCDRGALSQIFSTSRSNVIGSAAGAALGGLLGSKMGKGGGSTALTVLGVVGGALAGGYIGRSMDPTDQACVGQALEHTPTNQTVAWQNPDNGASYWVTPTQNYQGPSGEPCRGYVTQAVVNGQTQRSDGAACRTQQGAWQPASYGPGGGAAAPAAAPQSHGGGAVSKDTVLKVQQKLREQGFYVRDNIDGVWGPKTQTALANFQQANNLTPSGQLDVPTLQALGLSAPAGQ